MTGTFPLLFDDAAIFPPGNLPLGEAVAAHRAHRSSPHAALVGPLVVTLRDLPTPAALLPNSPALELAVVVPDAESAAEAIEQTSALHGVHLVALEVTDTGIEELDVALASSPTWTPGEPGDLALYVELPRDDRRPALIDALAQTPYGAKLRTGGTRAEAYPDESELAAALVALAARRVPFKATAGLHHALRNTDPATGFEQHGFLNLLAATDAAQRGAGVAQVAAVLAERDTDRVLAAAQGALTRTSMGGASLFRSLGTCSIADPVAELVVLGLLTPTDQPSPGSATQEEAP